MQQSSIYLKCPGCGDTTLVLRDARGCRCAACTFDYTALASDRPRFESYLVERMREGSMGQLGALALHQWLSGLGTAESTLAYRELAARNGVALPAPWDAHAFARRISIVVALVVVALVATVLYSVTRP